MKDYIWNGKIALMTAIEYMKGSTNSDCKTMFIAYKDATSCGSLNWLNAGIDEWAVPTYPETTSSSQWNIKQTGMLGDTENYFASSFRGVRPVVYISSNIHLDGSGTLDDPYTIIS